MGRSSEHGMIGAYLAATSWGGGGRERRGVGGSKGTEVVSSDLQASGGVIEWRPAMPGRHAALGFDSKAGELFCRSARCWYVGESLGSCHECIEEGRESCPEALVHRLLLQSIYGEAHTRYFLAFLICLCLAIGCDREFPGVDESGHHETPVSLWVCVAEAKDNSRCVPTLGNSGYLPGTLRSCHCCASLLLQEIVEEEHEPLYIPSRKSLPLLREISSIAHFLTLPSWSRHVTIH